MIRDAQLRPSEEERGIRSAFSFGEPVKWVCDDECVILMDAVSRSVMGTVATNAADVIPL